MKKYILSLLSLVAAYNIGAATYDDFRPGVDLTGAATVTASRLNQLVSNGTVNTNKGLVLVTNGTPNTASFPHYTNYIWMDTSTQPPVVKVYSATGGWNSIGLGTTNVTTDKIADGAVTSVKIAAGAVNTINISNNAVTSALLQDDAVTRAKIADGNVNAEHFATGAVGDSALTNTAFIGTSRIVDLSVTREKLALGSVGAGQLTNNVIYNSNLTANVIYGTNIAPNVISNSHIVTGTIRTNELDQQIITNLFLTKAFGKISAGGGSPTLLVGRNVATVGYSSVGKFSVSFTTAMATTNYIITLSTESAEVTGPETPVAIVENGTQQTTGFTIGTISTRSGGHSITDLKNIHFTVIE